MLTQRLYLQAGLRYQTTVVHYRDLLNAQNDYTVPNRGLYPNPTDGILSIELTDARQDGVIKITSAESGKTYYTLSYTLSLHDALPILPV